MRMQWIVFAVLTMAIMALNGRTQEPEQVKVAPKKETGQSQAPGETRKETREKAQPKEAEEKAQPKEAEEKASPNHLPTRRPAPPVVIDVPERNPPSTSSSRPQRRRVFSILRRR